MKTIFDELTRYGWDVLVGPERFREVLVIVFTGVGEHPGDVLRVLVAWFAAVLIAEKIYPKR